MVDIEIDRIMWEIGAKIKERAIELAPVDTGMLRNHIGFRVNGDELTIYCDVDYAKDMEYGLPPPVHMTPSDKQDLADWARRHGLPAGPVIKKIQKKGIAPYGSKDDILVTNPMPTYGTFRPFLRPAIHQVLVEVSKI